MPESEWRVTLNGRELRVGVEYDLVVGDDGSFSVNLRDQMLVLGAQARVEIRPRERLIVITAPRDRLLAMRRAVDGDEET